MDGNVHRLTRRAARDERGVFVVLLALTMTVLMIFVAFAIDHGLLRNERRDDQNAADAGALAGGQLLLTAPQDAIAQEARAVVERNLPPTEVPWATRWSSCVDSGRVAAGYTVPSSFTDCISFNRYGSRIRVRTPDVTPPVIFSRAGGLDRFSASAFAEAEIVLSGGSALLPFGVPQSVAGNDEVCLRAGPDGHAPAQPPCDGSATGNFGSMDIAWYGNPTLGTPEACTGQTHTRLAANIALGVDHRLDEYRGPEESPPEIDEAVRNDRDECADLGARPNEIYGQTGIGANLDDGLIAGLTVDGRNVPGRLTVTPFQKERLRGRRIDWMPLWNFIDPALTSPTIPASCVRSGITTSEQMRTCLADYRAGGYSVPLFTADTDGDTTDGIYDIERSPRFAWVPELWADNFDPSFQQRYTIKRFRPTFLQTLYFGCTESTCDVVFKPGEPVVDNPGGGPNKVGALTALMIPSSALPASVVAEGPHAPLRRQLVLRR